MATDRSYHVGVSSYLRCHLLRRVLMNDFEVGKEREGVEVHHEAAGLHKEFKAKLVSGLMS